MENPNTPNGDRNQNNQNNNAPRRQSFFLFLIAALLSLLCVSYFMKTISGSNTDEITYNEFIQKLEDGEIDTVVIGDNQLTITPKKTQSDTNMTIPNLYDRTALCHHLHYRKSRGRHCTDPASAAVQ